MVGCSWEKSDMNCIYDRIVKTVKAAVTDDDLRKRLLFLFVNGALAVTSMVMTIVNIFTKEYILMWSTLIYSVLCALNIFLLRHVTGLIEEYVYYLFAAESLVLIAFFFISGIPDGFSALWICLIPSFTLLIFGIKKGSILSMIALAMTIFFFWIPAGKHLLMHDYGSTFMLRFPFLYISIYVIALIIEYVRRETQNQLKKAKQEYQYLYRHDALTGLCNRYGINEYMVQAFENKDENHAAVIIMDIDDFKKINDVYGHECGDEVLRMVANVPLKIMCEHSHCCRWGGEEFLLIMQCGHDPKTVAENIRREVENTPVKYKDNVIHVTSSLGVCIADSLNGASIHNIVDMADKALYESKKNGKNQVNVCRI